MIFKEWIEWNWKPVGSDKEYIIINEREKAKSVSNILKKFTTMPTSVGRISRETFMSMPIADSNIGWPDFTPILTWMKENCSDEWLQYDPVNYIFVDPADAMAFILRWG